MTNQIVSVLPCDCTVLSVVGFQNLKERNKDIENDATLNVVLII